ncbi:MAG: diguanylate cyclase/phosphodiesterase with pas/pac sensor(s) [uncultured bacterium (gcode 4)]|uniref:Diguanylate cyclase/phosphodiesterase with pas/pac sensor(S) n=1 Tax=uncultured bacterium (gcode 4) TaxID=1234023 RepID=K2AYG1_9BACT|nr:MAG: diguanylate cyclase/phosphodiesterase with pas/pac sensor(s) [uncultured bacterium (gcode 4)]
MGLKLKLDRITCSREEIKEGIFLAPQENLDIKTLPKNVKRVVLIILEINKELKIDLSSKNYVNNFLVTLKRHSLEYYWLSSLVESILWVWESSFVDRRTWLPNDLKFLGDCNSPWKDEFEKDCNSPWKKLVFILKIDGFSKINWFYWRANWDTFINNIIAKFKGLFEGKLWFKLYKLSGLYFWLLTEKQFESSKELFEVIEEIRAIINNFHIDIELWENKEKSELKIILNGWCSHCKEKLFDKALLALYKSNKEGWLYFYTKEMEDLYKKELENNLLWSVKIIHWIKEDRFFPVFQWIRDNRTWKIIKYESLIRYRDDDGKIVSPYFFLDIAENMGKMLKLSEIMIEKVIKKMVWNNHSFSINLTEECLLNSEFMNFLILVVDDSLIDPSRLIIEVVETAVDKWWQIIKVIETLKNKWMKIAIDDFGSGMSNTTRVKSLKPDFVKIDWGLVKWMLLNKENLHNIEMLKQMADIYWVEVIAEFVDSKEKQFELEKIGVQYSQWYLYSVPDEKLCDEI